MNDYKILYKFASRERPEKMLSCIDNIIALSESNEFLIYLTLDSNDESTVKTEILEPLNGNRQVAYSVGVSAGKIDAINRNMDAVYYPWDICVVMSDDMVFLQHGFDNVIRQAFETHFPALDGCVHFHDGPYGKALMGLNIQGRRYFEKFGWLYCPEYKSLFCDNDQMECAKRLGKYVYMGDDVKIVEHRHPVHTPGLEYDDLLRRTESFYHEDEKTFRERQARNFDLPITGL